MGTPPEVIAVVQKCISFLEARISPVTEDVLALWQTFDKQGVFIELGEFWALLCDLKDAKQRLLKDQIFARQLGLCKAGGDMPRELHTALLQNDQKKILDLAVDASEETLQNMLYISARNGSDLIISWLLSGKVDINGRDPYGCTALLYAVQASQASTTALILEAGGEVNHKDASGATALHHAASTGECNILLQLLSHGADVSVQDEAGYTPLMLACQHQHVNAATCILARAECNVNATDIRGETALFKAVRARDWRITQVLLGRPSCDMDDLAAQVTRDLSSIKQIHELLSEDV